MQPSSSEINNVGDMFMPAFVVDGL